MALISTLVAAALVSTGGPTSPPVSPGVLQIESELVIHGRVRKPQVFFMIPKKTARMGDEIAAVADPVDEVVRLGAVNLAPTRTVDLDELRRSSLLGQLEKAVR